MSDAARLVFGAASLGSTYGLPRPGATKSEERTPAMDAALVERAIAGGIRIFDTAPAYGASESRLGEILGEGGVVWTKVHGDPASPSFEADALASIERSCERLRRSKLDLVQWHNWGPALGHIEGFAALWERLRRDPRVGGLGASTYGAEDAAAAIESGLFSTVQVEWNVLNRSVVGAVGKLAREHGVTLAVRSVLLQGALTDEGRELPRVSAFEAAVRRWREVGAAEGRSLTEVAVRAALDEPDIGFVLLGFDEPAQIDVALQAARSAPLSASLAARVSALDLGGAEATDPRAWSRLAAEHR